VPVGPDARPRANATVKCSTVKVTNECIESMLQLPGAGRAESTACSAAISVIRLLHQNRRVIKLGCGRRFPRRGWQRSLTTLNASDKFAAIWQGVA